MSANNTWDYKVGDLIQVEKLGWPIENGVIIKCVGAGEENRLPLSRTRKCWEWVGTKGRTQFFFEVKSPLQEDFKVKILARAKTNEL